MINDMITVVVPVYNMGHLLPRAIDCLLAQTYRNYEIIIVDDGSTDDSGEICDRCVALDSGIRVIHKENGGLSSARNCGIANANGEFIIFPDPDDWTDPHYLEMLINLHREYKTDLEIGGHYVEDDKSCVIHNDGKCREIINADDAVELLMSSKAFCGFAWNKLYHMDIIEANALRFDTELGMAQDLHFAFRYIALCEKIAYDPAPAYHYFQHAGGVTNTKSPLSARKISGLKTYEKIAELAKDKYPNAHDAALSTLFNMSLHFIFIYYESKMSDKLLLVKLKENLRLYKEYFFKNPNYSKSRKLLGRIALVSPWAYHKAKKTLS